MAEAMRPIHVRRDAQRVRCIEKAEEIGAAGPHVLKGESAVELVLIADRLIEAQLHSVLVGVSDYRDLIVVQRISRDVWQRI